MYFSRRKLLNFLLTISFNKAGFYIIQEMCYLNIMVYIPVCEMDARQTELPSDTYTGNDDINSYSRTIIYYFNLILGWIGKETI